MMSSYKEHLDLKGFDDEDDLSDDEVFTRGGKSIPLEENGVNKPLMAPRQRVRDSIQTKVRKVPPIRVIWAPAIYFLITLSTIIGIICLVVFLINVFMKNMTRTTSLNIVSERKKWTPCSKITTEDVWTKSFPMLTTETAVRLMDVNSDGIEDIILGFGTGADAFYYPPVVCQVYFPDAREGCGGGMMALDGKSGAEIWRHYSPHEIFAINCNADLDHDGVKDCVGGGRMAVFRAVNGKDGKLLWDFNDAQAKVETSNIYTPQYISDVDYDGVPDLVVVHGGDPMKEPGSSTRLIGRLMIVSGKTGQVLKWAQVPDKKESYYSPQVLTHPDGTQLVLFGTGGETHGGSLWYIKLQHLFKGEMHRAKIIYTDTRKGVMTPPVLIDITGDKVLDVVMAMFNSTVVAFDGLTLTPIWKYHQPSSESYSTPGVGYFNDDNVPDFIINYQTGPGFPIYYYTQTTILDGRTGRPLLKKPIEMVVGTQSSPLVISVDGAGNDIFLYWVSDCHDSRNASELEFDFLKGTSVHEQSRADFCKLRFKKKLFTRMYALSSHNSSPGIIIYDSDRRKEVEYSNPINYSALGLEFLYRHPEYQTQYEQFLERENSQLLENGDFPDSDLPNQYDDFRLQRMLNNQKININNRQNNGNSPMIDQNEYNPQDDPSEDAVYPPYYVQQKYDNLGNDLYYPLDYYRDTTGNNPENYAYSRNFRPKKVGVSANQFRGLQNPYESFSSVNMNNQRDNKPHEKPLRRYMPRQQRSRIGGNWMKSLRYAKPEPRHTVKRIARHVGPHDGGGIQRVISTGTLAPILNSKNDQGIDVIFATFWFFPSSIQGLLPQDKKCIEAGMMREEGRFKPTSQFYGMDHDAYEEMVAEECLRKSGNLRNDKPSSTQEYNPFNRPMGQMTVYRIHVKCKCSNSTAVSSCRKVLPFEQQGWPSYMGRNGNSVANPSHSH